MKTAPAVMLALLAPLLNYVLALTVTNVWHRMAALAFAVAHVPLGIPVVVLAARVAGAFWSALVVTTRSGIPALISHTLWDLAVLYWAPYLR